jgi:hypothetical protein
MSARSGVVVGVVVVDDAAPSLPGVCLLFTATLRRITLRITRRTIFFGGGGADILFTLQPEKRDIGLLEHQFEI